MRDVTGRGSGACAAAANHRPSVPFSTHRWPAVHRSTEASSFDWARNVLRSHRRARVLAVHSTCGAEAANLWQSPAVGGSMSSPMLLVLCMFACARISSTTTCCCYNCASRRAPTHMARTAKGCASNGQRTRSAQEHIHTHTCGGGSAVASKPCDTHGKALGHFSMSAACSLLARDLHMPFRRSYVASTHASWAS